MSKWFEASETPSRAGWYEVLAGDDRWGGKSRWRAWGKGCWWIPLAPGDGSGGWISGPHEGYRWKLPRHDISGPKPVMDKEMDERANHVPTEP
jgi:hypothetical protein